MINCVIDRESCPCSADRLIGLPKKLLVYLDKELNALASVPMCGDMRAVVVSILFIYSICFFVSFSVIFDVLTNSKECIPQAQSSILLSRTGSRSQCRQESSYQKDISDLPRSTSCYIILI